MTSISVARRSQATRDLMRKKALERGEKRSQKVIDDVLDAMQHIEAQIAMNNGVYPFNDGIIHLVDVARIANIHPTTFYAAKHKQLGVKVQQWLLEIQKPVDKIHCPARRDLKTRIADWKNQYEGLLQSHRDTELALLATTNDLKIAISEIESLKRKNRDLQLEISLKSGEIIFCIPGSKITAANS